jgi:2-polyprenyl-3-methyl-5-hydroxy-6-metoxy-1,4-benzoquinol methylase
MKEFGYEKFYDRVGAENGWDFSRVKCQTEGVLWDFYEEVKKSSQPTDILLDIGTGGGEKVIPLAASYLLVVGIDQSKGMIQTAIDNFRESGTRYVRF